MYSFRTSTNAVYCADGVRPVDKTSIWNERAEFSTGHNTIGTGITIDSRVTMSLPARKHLDAPRYWQPPVGWRAVAGGVWIPPDYHPSDWEVQSPIIQTWKDAQLDYLKCSRSLPHFVFSHCWTVDVDDPEGASVRKFPAYPYFRRFFKSVQEPQNTHVEKSRQMTLSWSWMAVVLWDILFHDRWTDLVISKRAKDVDDGGAESTIDSNFGKLRFMHAHLPEHLWERFEYKKFIVRNPRRNSHVKGETGKGSAASRGPTYLRAIMDEAAYIERGETVFKGVRQASKTGTSLNSTPNGKGNVFARIRFSTTTTFLKLRFHWTEHPRKAAGLYCVCGWQSRAGTGMLPHVQFAQHDCGLLKLDPPRSPEPRSPWYDEQAQDMRPEDIASELDISYEKSRRGAVFSAFDSARNVWPIMHRLGPRKRYESLDEYRLRYLAMVLEPEYQYVVGWDFGVGDPAVMLLGQIVDDYEPRVRIVDEIEEADKSYDFYANIVNTVWRPALDRAGNRFALRHYGGKDVKNRDSKLESWYSNLRMEGITVEYREFGQLLEWVDYINDTYRHGLTEISDWCARTIDCTQNYHYPVNSDGERLPGVQLPVHDEWSHAMDAKRGIFKVRYAAKLHNRKKKAVPSKRMLSRGGGYDKTNEHRIY